ncbi:androgen-induced gene 1 protein-like [Copidosoma floridanum]|uniref:androgen-induced gene 1 protein-like n=1 Tax=Copidosoma floridanum TaxID=29053 RepID=UPI0006C9E17D|nr:androgen-induced gene 1 protein-like [Copidosoma floridanum]
MREKLLVVFHAAAFAQFFFAVYYDYTYTRVPVQIGKVHNAYGGKFKFLTFWNAIAQTIFFLLCMLNDIFGTNSVNPKKRPFIRQFKDYFYAAIGYPVSMVSQQLLMFIDRELVLPKALDPYFPWWLNHLMHTMIMITTVLEMLMAPRQYPKRSKGLGGLAFFMLAYLSWMHFVWYKSGVWAYPIIEILTVPLRVAFYLTILTLVTGLYFIGETVDRLIWGKIAKSVEKSGKKKK